MDIPQSVMSNVDTPLFCSRNSGGKTAVMLWFFRAVSILSSMAPFFLCLLMFGCNMSARSSVINGECPGKIEIPTCESIYNTSKFKGYTYPLPQGILTYLTLKDCEHAWFQNRTCIAYSDGSVKLELVVDASINLTTRTCEKNISLEVKCENPQFSCTIMYAVLHFNSQAGSASPKDEQDGLPAWGIALIVIGILIGTVIGFGFYYHQNCRNGSQNRDRVV